MIHGCDVKMAICGRGAGFFTSNDWIISQGVPQDGSGAATGADSNTYVAGIVA